MPRRKLTKAERRVTFSAKILPHLRKKYGKVCRNEKLSQGIKLERWITTL